MSLVWLVLIPVIGGLLAWAAGRRNPGAVRWIALASAVVELALAVAVWIQTLESVRVLEPGQQGQWLLDYRLSWIPQLGISFHLALDGISLLMVVLTAFLGIICVLTSWTEIEERVGFFHFNLLWVIAGIQGVFLAMDLFLFYFFWEMMLIPMYLLIGIWGHENRLYAAIKFFIFTQASGLLMLIAILGLYFVHYQETGDFTYDYFDLLGTSVPAGMGIWLMLGFLAAFLVKLPAFPFHTWLPDAHTEAPTAGSVILAGLLLKTGAYGMIRFVLPLFPEAAAELTPLLMVVAIIGILYGAILAFGQSDLKRLIAYTSVSHLGFVLLGIFAWNELAMQGAIMQMICHGLSTGALFILVGTIQEHIHTRDMNRMGGLWDQLPRMGAVALFFAMASLGLPGLGNFIGEFLVLVGTFQSHVVIAAIATLGLVAATVYSLWMIQQTFQGQQKEKWSMPDLNWRRMIVMGSLMIGLLWLGLYPKPVLNTAKPAIRQVQSYQPATNLVNRASQPTGPESSSIRVTP